MVCYIRKYVIILGGDIPVDVPPTKILGGCVPGIPGGVDASDNHHIQRLSMAIYAYAVYISESTATCKPGDE